ncbi:ubiquinone/menaquinone biosynthesis C-methylase UbiE [Antricoccus suffuscus]|uniref:Ubiquinone/menaquinone biosynthesis C-methylase UbiE n=1 Tax=Antricoccus suffuscus TaxID=1629062 RepID=A0A2T0ZWS2_9ACTN|nr:class I SAM-dependent methyltransferase [Antricoccus suffuscus]PRZ40734.1 ubiquinone/menaquinone biosynthesis C-methylase UbiE [Antricoccus suffuscus]
MESPAAARAYSRRAQEYADLFGAISATADPDRELIGNWAAGLSGRLLDVGCGPGQWTGWLHGRGIDIEGVDPAPEFVAISKDRHPQVRFSVGRAERLEVRDASLGGILAWYSLIHIEPARIGAVLAEFARAIQPNGGLCLGFCEGPELASFEHAVTTAYFWPVPRLISLLERAGFKIVRIETRSDAGVRPHGAIVASRGGS